MMETGSVVPVCLTAKKTKQNLRQIQPTGHIIEVENGVELLELLPHPLNEN